MIGRRVHELKSNLKPLPLKNICLLFPEKLSFHELTLWFQNSNSLIPRSDAYSHLCQTNVSSYAIAGSWKPNATDSHSDQERVYKVLTKNPEFRLNEDGFQDDNDLVVNITSQLGGLQNQTFQPNGNNILIISQCIIILSILLDT